MNIKQIIDYFIIKNSGLFDCKFYQDTYMKNDFNPLKDYVKRGFKKGRLASADFDTEFYKQKYMQEKDKSNPLIHYIRKGRRNNYKTNNFISVDYEKKLSNIKYDLPKDEVIDICIPVYNGYDYLKPLFDSILKNTTHPYNLIVCNDCSSDNRVYSFLEELKEKFQNLTIINNEINLGFIKTINKLYSFTKGHFVILNTDTEVPYGWLEHLMYPIFYMDKIASTTPFTNSGTICSFPIFCEDNKLLDGFSLDEIDFVFKKIDLLNTYIEIPTGVGFCMGVNKAVADKIGMFNEIFGKGYGEENDWCQRAIKHGYKNIHVTNLFVYHKHGGSFQSLEKQELINKNSKILNSIHSNYNQDVHQFILKDELDCLRKYIFFKLASSKDPVVIFSHELGGGTETYLQNKINQYKAKNPIFIVRCSDSKSKIFKMNVIYNDINFEYRFISIDELFNLLVDINFKYIIVNSLVDYPNLYTMIDLVIKLKKQNTKIIIPIHDYFTLCPNYILLQPNEKFCNIPNDCNICKSCLKSDKNLLKHFINEYNVIKWRMSWEKLILVSDEIICFSNSSYDLFTKIYTHSNVKIIPHQLVFPHKDIFDKRLFDQKRVIGILGNIGIHKGAGKLKQLADYIKVNKLDIKIVVIGNIDRKFLSKYIKRIKSYNVGNIVDLIIENHITDFFIPSICPETFSYTTSEIMQMGYPLTVFNIGAPAERVRGYRYGKVIEMDNFEKIITDENYLKDYK